jgi:hypothetical protein
MKLFNPEEIEKLQNLSKRNDKFDEFYSEKREEWQQKTNPLYGISKGGLSSSDSDRIINAQALALSYRQELQEEISYFLNKRTKSDSKVKEEKADKFLFYATAFGLKTNTGEKSILIDSSIREHKREVDLIDIHIDFLRNTDGNLNSFLFSIKNIIALLEYLQK